MMVQNRTAPMSVNRTVLKFESDPAPFWFNLIRLGQIEALFNTFEARVCTVRSHRAGRIMTRVGTRELGNRNFQRRHSEFDICHVKAQSFDRSANMAKMFEDNVVRLAHAVGSEPPARIFVSISLRKTP